MPNMRLAYVTTVATHLGFFRGHVAYLKSRGTEVHVISSPGKDLERFGDESGVTVHPVFMTRSVTPIQDLRSAWQLARVLRELRPQVLHASTPKAGLLGSLVARLTGVPVVVTSLFGLPQMTKTGPRRRLLDATTRLSCRCSDRVWCDSFSMRDYATRAGLCPADKLMVLGQGSVGGVDAQGAFSPERHGAKVRDAIRQRYRIPGDAQVLGYVGPIVIDKGMHELAAAWHVLREKRADLHLLLVGPFEASTPLSEDDQRLFQTDPRVHLAGEQHDIPPFLAAMDINVMPSYREGFGVTNIEAAAMGLPVVATLIPGCVDSVQDGVTGILVPPRNATRWPERSRLTSSILNSVASTARPVGSEYSGNSAVRCSGRLCTKNTRTCCERKACGHVGRRKNCQSYPIVGIDGRREEQPRTGHVYRVDHRRRRVPRAGSGAWCPGGRPARPRLPTVSAAISRQASISERPTLLFRRRSAVCSTALIALSTSRDWHTSSTSPKRLSRHFQGQRRRHGPCCQGGGKGRSRRHGAG